METLALALLILSSYIGDILLSRYGDNWGYAGLVLGPVIFWFSVQGIAWLERQLFIGQEPLPKCKCQKGPINELEDSPDSKAYIPGKGKKVCKCGIYTIGRGIIKYQTDESSEPIGYAKWVKQSWQSLKS